MIGNTLQIEHGKWIIEGQSHMIRCENYMDDVHGDEEDPIENPFNLGPLLERRSNLYVSGIINKEIFGKLSKDVKSMNIIRTNLTATLGSIILESVEQGRMPILQNLYVWKELRKRSKNLY